MSDNKEIVALVTRIVTELQRCEARKRARSENSQDGFRNAVMEILCLVIRSSVNPHWPPLTLSLRRGDYSRENRYKPMRTSYRHLRYAYRAMLQAGLLTELRKGWFDIETASGRKTSFLPTQKLQATILNISQETRRSILKQAISEPIIMKAKSGQRTVQKDYEDTDLTRKMRYNLGRINSCLARHWFDLQINDEEFTSLGVIISDKQDRSILDLSQNRLRRIFAQGSFELGGRFYGGWWQHVPKKYRPFITIDGKQTCEYDYSQLNPHIAYQYAGKVIGNEDAYSRIAGEEYREVAKEAFNAMLNSTTHLTRKPRKLDLQDKPFTWHKLREKVLIAHEPIEELFFKGLGLRFQNLDSQVAEKVMLSFLRDDTPCLPIHDSFIMHHAYGENLGELEEVMRRSYRSIVGADIEAKGTLVSRVNMRTPGYNRMKVIDPIALISGPPDFQGWWRRNMLL